MTDETTYGYRLEAERRANEHLALERRKVDALERIAAALEAGQRERELQSKVNKFGDPTEAHDRDGNNPGKYDVGQEVFVYTEEWGGEITGWNENGYWVYDGDEYHLREAFELADKFPPFYDYNGQEPNDASEESDDDSPKPAYNEGDEVWVLRGSTFDEAYIISLRIDGDRWMYTVKFYDGSRAEYSGEYLTLDR